MLEYDHSTIVIDNTSYVLSLETKTAIIAAKVIASISALGTEFERLARGQIIRAVWDSMTLDERELFTDKETTQFGVTAPNTVRDRVISTITGLAGQIHLIRSGLTTKNIQLVAGNVSMSYQYASPLETEQDAVMIFPPGTDIDFIQPLKPSRPTEAIQISDEDRAAARVILDQLILPGDPTVSEPDAIAMLSAIMRKEGKAALAALILERNLELEPEAANEKVFSLLKDRLGPQAYNLAHKERRVSGYKISGDGSRVAHTAGARRDRGRTLTTNWYLGTRRA